MMKKEENDVYITRETVEKPENFLLFDRIYVRNFEEKDRVLDKKASHLRKRFLYLLSN